MIDKNTLRASFCASMYHILNEGWGEFCLWLDKDGNTYATINISPELVQITSPHSELIGHYNSQAVLWDMWQDTLAAAKRKEAACTNIA